MEFYYFGAKKSPQIKAKIKNESGTIPNSNTKIHRIIATYHPRFECFKKSPPNSSYILYQHIENLNDYE